MYSFLSNVYPKKVRESFYKLLNYFEIKVRNEFLLGSLLFFSLGISISIAFQFSTIIFSDINNWLALLILFVGSMVILNVLVFSLMGIIASNRGLFVESVLPDSLELIAANLRAGMTIDRALIAANRKEFGYLNYLYSIVGKEISTGKDITDALVDITSKIKSEKFQKTMELIVLAMKSGGELSRLLGQVAENLVHQKAIEDKINASVTTYLIFIGAAVAFAAPFLYGLSSAFVKIIVSSFSNVNMPTDGASSMPFKIQLSDEIADFLPGFVKFYAKLCISTLGIMSSFMLGIIKRGKAKFGLNYIPFIVGGGLTTYMIVSYGANLLFSSVS